MCKQMRHCAIWYYLYNLNNGKNTHGGILLLVKVTLLHECFRRLENSTNRIKSRKALQIITTRSQLSTKQILFLSTRTLDTFSQIVFKTQPCLWLTQLLTKLIWNLHPLSAVTPPKTNESRNQATKNNLALLWQVCS